MSYNEIYGRYRHDLRGFRRSTRKTEGEDDGPIGSECNNYYRISIWLSFASFYTEWTVGRRELQAMHLSWW